MFAGAGLLWGAVTVYRGLQDWRHDLKRASASACAVGVFPLAKWPSIIIPGALLALGCTAYLVWSLWPL